MKKSNDITRVIKLMYGDYPIEQVLALLDPPLMDKTTGLPHGVVPTLDDYLNKTFGDSVQWDVKYWEAYNFVTECRKEEAREFYETHLA